MPRALLALLTLFALAPAASGQEGSFPERQIRMIVPFGSGSDVDASGRFFAEKLATVLGQRVVVENRPGADGVIGMVAAKRAPADGYTILLASNASLTVNPLVLRNLPYDPMKDFKPISGLTRSATVFVTAMDSRIRTLPELVAAMKQSSTPMTVGTFSTGQRLAIEWFSDLAGVQFTNVPYKGASTMLGDVLGGHVDWAVTDLIGAEELLRAGKLRAIAVSGDARHEDYPDVPTIRESGYPAYVNYTWSSLSVRAETPDDVTARLAHALQKVFALPTTREFLKRAKVELMPLPPAEQQKFQRAEMERLKRTAENAGIRPE